MKDIPSWGLADCYSCSEKQPPNHKGKKKMRTVIRHCKSSRCNWNGNFYVPYHFQFLQYIVKLGCVIYPFVARIIDTNTCIKIRFMHQKTQLRVSLLTEFWKTADLEYLACFSPEHGPLSLVCLCQGLHLLPIPKTVPIIAGSLNILDIIENSHNGLGKEPKLQKVEFFRSSQGS